MALGAKPPAGIIYRYYIRVFISRFLGIAVVGGNADSKRKRKRTLDECKMLSMNGRCVIICVEMLLSAEVTLAIRG